MAAHRGKIYMYAHFTLIFVHRLNLKGNALDSYWLIAICVPLGKVHGLCMNELNGIPIERLSSAPPKLQG